MLKRYDAIKEEMVELTQEYFDLLQSQFAQLMFHYSKNSPENYKNFKYVDTATKKADENA